FGLPRFQPLRALRTLALRTVTVAARVVRVAGKIAAIAFFDMAAESRCSAGLDGTHDAQLLIGKRVSFPVIRAISPENIGHFQSGPWHPGLFPGLLLWLDGIWP